MSLLCNLGLHRWRVWSKPVEYNGRVRPIVLGVPLAEWRDKTFLIQTRECNRCGIEQRRVTDLFGSVEGL